MFRRWSIRAQLLTLTLAVALPAAALIAYGILDAQRESLAKAQSGVRDVAAAIARELESFLRDHETLLARIAQRPLIQALDPQQCDSVVREYVAVRPEFTTLGVRDLRGKVICSYLKNPPSAERVAGLPWFQAAVRSGSFHVGGAYLGSESGRWVSVLMFPVRDAAGTMQGLMLLAIDLAQLQQRVMSALPKTAIGGVLDRDGSFLMRSIEAEKWVGRQGRVQGVPDEFWSQREGFVNVRGIDGVPRLYAVTTVAGADWHVFAGIPEEVVFAAHRQRLTISLLIGLVVLLAAAGVAWGISGAIAAPIRRLEATAAAVAGGNLRARASESGATEIARVSRQFNRMLDARDRAETELRLANQRYALAALTGDVWDWDIAGGAVSFPPEFWHRLGYGEAEAAETLKFFESILHQEDLARWREAVEDHIARRLPYDLEYRARTKSGEYRWFHTRGQAVWDASGRATYMAGTTFDITERKRTEEALRESEARLRNLFEQASDGIYLISAENRYLDANARGLELLGYTRDELLQMNVADVLAPQEVARLSVEPPRMMAGVPHFAEWDHVRNDGTTFPGEVSARRLDEHSYLAIVRDLTGRRRAEATLRQSEQRFRLAASTGDVWEVDVLTGSGHFPAQFKRGLGYEDNEIEDTVTAFATLVHPDDRARWQQALADHLARRLPYALEYRARSKSGDYRWFTTRGQAVWDANGRATYMAGTVFDITERKRAEETLRESEEKLRLFVHYAPSAIAMFDRDMHYVAFSGRWLVDYRLENRDLTGLSHYDVFPDLPERWKEIHRRCLAGAVESSAEDPFPRADGSTDWVRWEIHPWRKAGGEIGGVIIFSELITARKLAEDALREANERLRTLSARLLEVQEVERAALARELHDEIGQSLTALKLGAQGLARRLKGAAADSLAGLVSIADRTLAQTRSLSLDLRPPQLDQLGLAATLRDMLQRITDSAGIDARLVVEPENIALARGLATAAFRVAQEALTNAVRHAAARHVVVELHATHDTLHLAVSDDGRGFDFEAARSRAAAGASMGLLSIEERVALAGGELKIITRPGQGTRVEARLPLPPSRR